MSNENNKLKIRRILDSYLSNIDIIRFNKITGLYEVYYRDEKVTKYLTNRDIITIAIDEFLNESKWMPKDSIAERRKLLLIIMLDYYDYFIKKEFDTKFISKFLNSAYAITANHIIGSANQFYNINKILDDLEYTTLDKTCGNLKHIKTENNDSIYYYYFTEYFEEYTNFLIKNKGNTFVGIIKDIGISIENSDRTKLLTALESIAISFYKKNFFNNENILKINKVNFDNSDNITKDKKIKEDISMDKKNIKFVCNIVNNNISYFSALEFNKIKSIINSGGLDTGNLESYLIELLALRVSEELLEMKINEEYVKIRLKEIKHIFELEFNKLGLALINSINFIGLEFDTNSLTINSIEIDFVKGLHS